MFLISYPVTHNNSCCDCTPRLLLITVGSGLMFHCINIRVKNQDKTSKSNKEQKKFCMLCVAFQVQCQRVISSLLRSEPRAGRKHQQQLSEFKNKKRRGGGYGGKKKTQHVMQHQTHNSHKYLYGDVSTEVN